jgi:hypothetical protein
MAGVFHCEDVMRFQYLIAKSGDKGSWGESGEKQEGEFVHA